MIQMNFAFFNVEIICIFTSNFVDILSYTSYSFGFLFIRKRSPIENFKLLVTILGNQYNKVALIRVDGYGSLAIASKFM